MKKLAIILSLILTLFLFVGCVNTNNQSVEADSISVDMIVKQNSSGSVDIYYSVELGLTNLINNNDITESDANDFMTSIKTKAASLISKCKAQYKLDLKKYYDAGVISKEERNQLSNQFNIYVGGDKNSYLVQLNFASEKAYLVYTNYEKAVQNLSTTEGFFTNKYSKKTINPLGKTKDIFDGKATFKYFNDFKNEYLNSHFSSGVAAKFPELQMAYSLVTNSSKLHSDADSQGLTNLGYMHLWEINEKNYTKQIEFYTLSANPAVWYLLALTIVFAFVAIYLVVIYFKKPKKKINSGFDI